MVKKQLRTGVYVIENLCDGKLYVGSAARSFKLRFREHRQYLNAGTHHNRYLQRAWNKYGANSFKFRIHIRCSPIDCIEVEQLWINRLRVFKRKIGYNLNPTAGSMLGFKHSDSTKVKNKAKTTALWTNAEWRRNLISKHKERCSSEVEKKRLGDMARNYFKQPGVREEKSKVMQKLWADPNYRQAMVLRHKKRCADPKWQKKMKAYMATEDYRKKVSDGLKGHRVSDEARRNMSIAQRKRMENKSERDKIAKSLIGKKQSEATKLKRANTRTGMKLSEETKSKISASHRRRLQSI